MFLIIESHTSGQINHLVKRISSEQNQRQSNHRSQSEQRKILKELLGTQTGSRAGNTGNQVTIGFSFESDWLRK